MGGMMESPLIFPAAPCPNLILCHPPDHPQCQNRRSCYVHLQHPPSRFPAEGLPDLPSAAGRSPAGSPVPLAFPPLAPSGHSPGPPSCPPCGRAYGSCLPVRPSRGPRPDSVRPGGLAAAPGLRAGEPVARRPPAITETVPPRQKGNLSSRFLPLICILSDMPHPVAGNLSSEDSFHALCRRYQASCASPAAACLAAAFPEDALSYSFFLLLRF